MTGVAWHAPDAGGQHQQRHRPGAQDAGLEAGQVREPAHRDQHDPPAPGGADAQQPGHAQDAGQQDRHVAAGHGRQVRQAGLLHGVAVVAVQQPGVTGDEPHQQPGAEEAGPVAAVMLIEWRRGWGLDPIVVPDAGVPLAAIWEPALESVDQLAPATVETLARDDDAELIALLAESGFAPTDEQGGVTWLPAEERPPVAPLPDGFRLVNRERATTLHPMRQRSGEHVEERLRQCSLYDPALDLAVETDGGDPAGYSLYWLDPVTHVGLLEPMRVEDAYQRRGLARAMLTEGLDRLARRGAKRLKVGYGTGAARALYTGAGFRIGATSRTYRRTTAA